MVQKDNFVELLRAKEQCVENFERLKSALIQCVDEQRVEMEENLYNQTIVCIDGASILETWEEIDNLVFQGKILEEEIDAWLSVHELTSYSLIWPKRPM